MSVNTPHIICSKSDIADTVLMPGDPLRSKFAAETYLSDAKLFNNIRGIMGYTGNYKGKRVSVMASGMGMPSMGIYSYELFNFTDVKRIIRIGSAGGLNSILKLKDIVAAISASTDSNYFAQYKLRGTYAPTASYRLLSEAVSAAKSLGYSVIPGSVLSSDVFYDDLDALKAWANMGVLAAEMETAALYCNAARAGKEALALLTISDMIFEGHSCSAQERQLSFTAMMEIALEIA